MNPILAKRFWSKVNKTDTCWLWTASTSRGYGQIGFNGTMVKAHRVSYEVFKGKIPSGLEIDHLCRVKKCVNPDHLEVVTRTENIQRRSVFITHCPKGHEYSQKNTYYNPSKTGYCRSCRTCRNILRNEYRKKIKVHNGLIPA